MKAAFWALFLLTLVGGIITAGGLGSLTNQLGINSTPGFDFRLIWWYWCLEVFALLFAAAGVLVGTFNAFKPAFTAFAGYVCLGLTPTIQVLLDLSSSDASNVQATAAGVLIVVIGNFLLILLTAFFHDQKTSPQVSDQASDKV